MVTVHRYRVYDISRDDYVVSTRMATAEKIAKIGGEIIPGTEFSIDADGITDGWTEKNFEPLMYPAMQLQKRLGQSN
jgi:hypothetical protein